MQHGVCGVRTAHPRRSPRPATTWHLAEFYAAYVGVGLATVVTLGIFAVTGNDLLARLGDRMALFASFTLLIFGGRRSMTWLAPTPRSDSRPTS